MLEHGHGPTHRGVPLQGATLEEPRTGPLPHFEPDRVTHDGAHHHHRHHHPEVDLVSPARTPPMTTAVSPGMKKPTMRAASAKAKKPTRA